MEVPRGRGCDSARLALVPGRGPGMDRGAGAPLGLPRPDRHEPSPGTEILRKSSRRMTRLTGEPPAAPQSRRSRIPLSRPAALARFRSNSQSISCLKPVHEVIADMRVLLTVVAGPVALQSNEGDGAIEVPRNLAREYAKAVGLTCGEAMTREVITVAPETEIEAIAALLDARRIRRVPLVHERRLVASHPLVRGMRPGS